MYHFNSRYGKWPWLSKRDPYLFTDSQGLDVQHSCSPNGTGLSPNLIFLKRMKPYIFAKVF